MKNRTRHWDHYLFFNGITPASPSPPNPQLTQQFLSSVFSQRGPSALPYSEDTKWLIRQHLVSLSAAFPSLEPKTASFTHNRVSYRDTWVKNHFLWNANGSREGGGDLGFPSSGLESHGGANGFFSAQTPTTRSAISDNFLLPSPGRRIHCTTSASRGVGEATDKQQMGAGGEEHEGGE
ncbi:hypothetical protein TIFTF001_038608 [Ficus carica]|uniref:Uncharacterized protein n=1 Tax=Ficus carica TaxID=3494 RepID=A0AA88JA35_FICCA|nr:hypothetical protein TIFTF001_038608 [Ficus carica]